MPKKFYLGVDEAGYGPNLGPLVVAGSLWSAPARFTEEQFTAAFQTAFSTKPHRPNCVHVPLGDSKRLYSTQAGLATLEAGLLAMIQTIDSRCSSLDDLVKRVTANERIDELQALAWYANYPSQALPCAMLDRSEVLRLSNLASAGLAASEIELLDLRAAIICEPSFNRAVAQSGSKGELLSRVTLELVVSLLKQCESDTEIFCDRQGGRKNYLPQLLAAMPDEWFSELAVSHARSSYRNQGTRPLTIHFSVGGDSFPPTALASMLAKYVRERLMQVLNEYWCGQVAELRPTAGYPVDAQRFRQAIEPIAERLGLSIDQWWRCK